MELRQVAQLPWNRAMKPRAGAAVPFVAVDEQRERLSQVSEAQRQGPMQVVVEIQDQAFDSTVIVGPHTVPAVEIGTKIVDLPDLSFLQGAYPARPAGRVVEGDERRPVRAAGRRGRRRRLRHRDWGDGRRLGRRSFSWRRRCGSGAWARGSPRAVRFIADADGCGNGRDRMPKEFDIQRKRCHTTRYCRNEVARLTTLDILYPFQQVQMFVFGYQNTVQCVLSSDFRGRYNIFKTEEIWRSRVSAEIEFAYLFSISMNSQIDIKFVFLVGALPQMSPRNSICLDSEIFPYIESPVIPSPIRLTGIEPRFRSGQVQ